MFRLQRVLTKHVSDDLRLVKVGSLERPIFAHAACIWALMFLLGPRPEVKNKNPFLKLGGRTAFRASHLSTQENSSCVKKIWAAPYLLAVLWLMTY